jgi:hypothetical protein
VADQELAPLVEGQRHVAGVALSKAVIGI